jgi:acetyl esterase/lipase
MLFLLGVAMTMAGSAQAEPSDNRTLAAIEPELIVYKTVRAGKTVAEAADGAAAGSPSSKPRGAVTLRLHVFKPEALKAGERAPAVVFFFGGGWVGGTPRQFYPHCQRLASLGMVAASAEYRVRSRHKTSPFECVADGKSAVRFLRAHADELGIDPNRIVAGGGSAGGHVAASTGTLDGLDEPGEETTVSAVPDAMMLFNPVIDTTRRGYGAEKVGDRPEQLSPVHHVDEEVPPTIVFHGTADTTVPFENVQRFHNLMRDAGNACRLAAFEGQGHGFFNHGRNPDIFWKTMQESEAFLREYGILD